MLDPFKDLEGLSPELLGDAGMVEHFGLDAMREQLTLLPPESGAWPSPASLSRLGLTEMPFKMLRRFEKHIKVAQLDYVTPCWIWTGGAHDKGYGRFYLGKDPDTDQKIWTYTHRISFEHWVGFPPPGYIVDHECNHKPCCNPTHVWPQTNRENLRLADERRPWKRRNQYSQE